jgi:hypothetical protein
MNVATFAISWSVIDRRGWVLFASTSCHSSQVILDAAARARRRLIVRVSGIA